MQATRGHGRMVEHTSADTDRCAWRGEQRCCSAAQSRVRWTRRLICGQGFARCRWAWATSHKRDTALTFLAPVLLSICLCCGGQGTTPHRPVCSRPWRWKFARRDRVRTFSKRPLRWGAVQTSDQQVGVSATEVPQGSDVQAGLEAHAEHRLRWIMQNIVCDGPASRRAFELLKKPNWYRHHQRGRLALSVHPCASPTPGVIQQLLVQRWNANSTRHPRTAATSHGP